MKSVAIPRADTIHNIGDSARSTQLLVTFITKTIAPPHLPLFPYQAARLHSDTIEYTATILAHDINDAHDQVTSLWADARVIESYIVPRGQQLIPGSILAPILGCLPPVLPPPPKPGAFTRFWVWLVGEGPILKN